MAKVTRMTTDSAGGLERRRLHLREISEEDDTPLETVGQDLRAARQRKGEDLASVSKALKIRKDHIEALETSNLDALPGRAYAIGFLRSYSEYLGLDGARCIERFKAEIAGRDGEQDQTTQITIEEERKLPQGTVVVVVLLLVAVAYGGYYLSISANRMLSQSLTVPERLADEAGDPRQPVSQAPEPSAIAPAPQGPADVQAETETASISDMPASPPPSNIPSAADVAALPQGRAFGMRNGDSRVVLRIHAQTRVLVQGADNTVFMNRALRPGDVYKTPNLVGLQLTTPDSGAVEILLDGSSIGFVGSKGAVSEGLSLNPQDLVDRYNQTQSG